MAKRFQFSERGCIQHRRIQEPVQHTLHQRVIKYELKSKKYCQASADFPVVSYGRQKCHGKPDKKPDDQQNRQVHQANDPIAGHRREHQQLPDFLRKGEIIIHDIVVIRIPCDIRYQCDNCHGKSCKCPGQIFIGGVLIFSGHKEQDQHQNNQDKIEHLTGYPSLFPLTSSQSGYDILLLLLYHSATPEVLPHDKHFSYMQARFQVHKSKTRSITFGSDRFIDCNFLIDRLFFHSGSQDFRSCLL